MAHQKKFVFIVWIVFSVLLLSACTSASTAASSTVSQAQSGDEQSTAVEGTLQAPSGDQPEGGFPQDGTMPADMPTPDGTRQPGGGPQGGPQGGGPQGGDPQGSFQGTPPADMGGGQPPDGQGGQPPSGGQPGQPGGDQQGSSSYTITGAYTIDGTTTTESGQTYTASGTDQSAILVTNGGSLTLDDATITTTGASSSSDASSFYGLNAGVLANAGGTITMTGSTVTTSGEGANGVFAEGEGSSATLENVTITATGNYAHGVMVTNGATMTLTNVDMNTAGSSSGAIASDRGSGSITVNGGTVVTTGSNSPGIYSTGIFNITGADISSTGSEAAVIEGANTITLTNTDLSSSFDDKWGVMIYQSMSGDAEGTEGTFSMTGGSLSYTGSNGPLFFVTNSTANITLKNVDLTVSSNILVDASFNQWGTSGANGGTVNLTADDQALEGNITADSISSVTIALQNGSTLTGAMDADNTARAMILTLDGSSTWNVTADSYLTCLNDSEGISGTNIKNINGNGYTVYYDSATCTALGGNTYSLTGGGTLKPIS